MQRKTDIKEVLNTLELPLNSWTLNNTQMSIKEANICLTKFKALVKKQHHVLVKKYHPDIPTNGSTEETKMKKINAIIDTVNNLKILIQPPRPQRVTVRFYRTTGFSDSSTSTTSSNFFSFY